MQKETMKQDVFQYFGVAPASRDEALVIGFDNGAGNCCAVLMEYIGTNIQARRLCFDVNGADTNLFTVLARAGGEELVGREALRVKGVNKSVYVGFKRPPGTEDARQAYGGDLDQPSYEDIMRRFFRTALREVFRHNQGHLAGSGKKRALLFVGRPASQVWQEHALDYQRLLGEGLSIEGFDGKIDLIVYSEAQAALAYEYSQGKIGAKEYILIVDCGSSTFDAVLVHNRAIITEYSRQIGAGEIEALMLDVILSEGAAGVLDYVDARLAMREDKSRQLTGAGSWADHVAMLRSKKEDYFGPNGDNGDPDLLYSVQLLNDDKQTVRKARCPIDQAFMQQVLDRIPIRVPDSYTGAVGSAYGCTEYPSFSQAVLAFLQETKRQCAAHGCPADKVRVILTGGASVMPFIGSQVRQVFGPNAFGRDAQGHARPRSENPAFSVGEGLAFMGTVELSKRAELENLRALVRKELEDKSFQFRYQVIQSILNAAWGVIDREFTQWGQSHPCDTGILLKATLNLPPSFFEPITIHAAMDKLEWSAEANKQVRLDLQNMLTKRKWGTDPPETLTDRLTGEIQKRFGVLFPGIRKSAYQFTIPSDLIGDALNGMTELTVSQLSYTKLFGLFNTIFGAAMDTPLPQPKRQQYAATVRQRENTIRKALEKHLSQGDGAADVRAATETIRETITEAMSRKIEDYIEDITPYFVERYGG